MPQKTKFSLRHTKIQITRFPNAVQIARLFAHFQLSITVFALLTFAFIGHSQGIKTFESISRNLYYNNAFYEASVPITIQVYATGMKGTGN